MLGWTEERLLRMPFRTCRSLDIWENCVTKKTQMACWRCDAINQIYNGLGSFDFSLFSRLLLLFLDLLKSHRLEKKDIKKSIFWFYAPLNCNKKEKASSAIAVLWLFHAASAFITPKNKSKTSEKGDDGKKVIVAILLSQTIWFMIVSLNIKIMLTNPSKP